MRRLLVVLALLAPMLTAGAQRTYWPRSIDSLAIGHVPHTHVEATGRVSYVANETDGDKHIRLTSPSGNFIVCECIPEFPGPCAGVHAGDSVTVRGIYRHDPEHGWWEIHPVETLTILNR